MKKFNLSDKIIHPILDEINYKCLEVCEVKEFIKKVKGPIEAELKFIENSKHKNSQIATTVKTLFNQTLKNINKLAGDELK